MWSVELAGEDNLGVVGTGCVWLILCWPGTLQESGLAVYLAILCWAVLRGGCGWELGMGVGDISLGMVYWLI